jgi:hypothetical protein
VRNGDLEDKDKDRDSDNNANGFFSSQLTELMQYAAHLLARDVFEAMAREHIESAQDAIVEFLELRPSLTVDEVVSIVTGLQSVPTEHDPAPTSYASVRT